MYHAIVRRQVRKIFEGLSRGDWQSALAGMADRFEHIIPGDHALGGTRHTKTGLRAWFKRLFSVHPVSRFEIKHIAPSRARGTRRLSLSGRLCGNGRR